MRLEPLAEQVSGQALHSGAAGLPEVGLVALFRARARPAGINLWIRSRFI